MWKLLTGPQTGGHPYLTTLNNFEGRQTWEYFENAGTAEERSKVEQLRANFTKNRLTQKHSSDELLRLQTSGRRKKPTGKLPVNGLSDKEGAPESAVVESLRGGLSFYESLQADGGHWPGDYGGPMFLMPGLIITCYTTGTIDTIFSSHDKQEILRYLVNHQNDDGGYGLHIEGHSTMFGSVLSYVSMRLLGMDAEDEPCARARDWIHSRGGATYITSWGKFWLAVLGVYSWDGMNPTPPEMWLLPSSGWTGIGWLHPGRFWCHCRMVYLPMSYIYGKRTTCKETPLTAAIRDELYPRPYASIDWNLARNQCASTDLYYPHPKLQDVLWWSLYKAEYWLQGSWLRKKALEECMRHIHYEDENTRYVCIGPVNKVINMLCCWVEDPDSEAFKRHIPRVRDFLWVAEDGMKMQGYNGSQNWDTTFAVQAVLATGLGAEFGSCLRKAHSFIERTQVLDDAPGPLWKWYRHISKGAWPFSTRDHGWPISDCSSEGLKAALALAREDPALVGPSIPIERLQDCVNVLLSYQNGDGGWATYENTRSFALLEIINPSETFGDIVIDYSYIECSSACITALAAFQKRDPGHRAAEIARALERGEKFMLKQQRKDGSWYGSWGVCFTYGAWFGCEALAALGKTVENSASQRASCEFLISKQRKDGGWAETYLSCQDKEYSQPERDADSLVVNTGWALIALMSAGYQRIDPKPIHAGVRFLVRSQLPSGDWPQQLISGVFNRNCMITYANYRNIFPIWALGMYRSTVLQGTTH